MRHWSNLCYNNNEQGPGCPACSDLLEHGPLGICIYCQKLDIEPYLITTPDLQHERLYVNQNIYLCVLFFYGTHNDERIFWWSVH